MKQKILLYGLGVVFLFVLYKSTRRKSVVSEVDIKNFTTHRPEEIDLEHITQEEIATTNIHIDPVLPDFGKPELVEEHFKNYVNVQKNEYFKPQISPFFK